MPLATILPRPLCYRIIPLTEEQPIVFHKQPPFPATVLNMQPTEADHGLMTEHSHLHPCKTLNDYCNRSGFWHDQSSEIHQRVQSSTSGFYGTNASASTSAPSTLSGTT